MGPNLILLFWVGEEGVHGFKKLEDQVIFLFLFSLHALNYMDRATHKYHSLPESSEKSTP